MCHLQLSISSLLKVTPVCGRCLALQPVQRERYNQQFPSIRLASRQEVGTLQVYCCEMPLEKVTICHKKCGFALVKASQEAGGIYVLNVTAFQSRCVVTR